ncbi:AraC family transcriptional regulator [Paraliomyxa miuraensis]|uniref:AraC family transcriptional regulator n=1 Tax=Paraliomyxa miuraensis TaxID=376150 RepID=UPI002259BCF2|nr:AraC family transcriptional regulator [Paraliomyxa miuraensis]MCX4240991.1 AraC family transcriptional regulator [Paraliomyxa miuraensis]
MVPTRAEIPTDGTVAAAVTARLIQHAASNGVSLRGLLQRVGWRSPVAPNPDARVPFAVHWSVWRHVHEQGVPGDFGLTFADDFELDHLGVLGMLMTHSATVEEAVRQQNRFQRLLLDVPFEVTRLEPRKLVIEHPPLPIAMELPHMIVAGLAYWMKLLRMLVQGPVDALCVELPHAPLTSPQRYRATFGVRPRFDAPHVRLELDRAWWSAPVRAPASGLDAHLRARATALLRRLPRRGERLDAVREYIAEALRHGRHPTLVGAAKRMGTSTRTLQRTLRAAELSYDALLDETRQRLSLEYLDDDRLTIGEVAVVLGYSEPATFYRAFKRWTGVPPGAYRARLS